MRSQNFEFLRARRPALADIAAFAEKYAHEDPASSLVKQRVMVEHFVLAIYEAYGLRLPYSDSLGDYMGDEAFRQSVPVVVQTKLHIARKAGNIGAHTRAPVTPEQALSPLAELFEAARVHNASQTPKPSTAASHGGGYRKK
jgi:type I restriction enzyme R subunit